MTGSATFRRIASDVQKIALLIALRACVRRCCSSDEKSTFRTFPIRKATFRTDILIKFPISSIATVRTHPFLWMVFHFIYLSFFWLMFLIFRSFIRLRLDTPKIIEAKRKSFLSVRRKEEIPSQRGFKKLRWTKDKALFVRWGPLSH